MIILFIIIIIENIIIIIRNGQNKWEKIPKVF